MTEKTFDQEDRRDELVAGEIVAMSPSPGWNHITIAGNIYRIFGNFLKGKPCKAIPDGLDLQIGRAHV